MSDSGEDIGPSPPPPQQPASEPGSRSPSPGPPLPPPEDDEENSTALVPSGNGESSTALQVPRSRPARQQITTAKLEAIRQAADKGAQSGTTYNIWYNKWSGGDREDGYNNKTKAETRCDIARDSGYTRADAAKGSAYCLFFARGHCPLGAECTFLHRLPATNYNPEQGRDIFGREKHGDYRDDMGGVGSLQRVNRTLYVGRIVEEQNTSSRGGGVNVGGLGAQWRDGGRTVKGGRSVGDALRSQGKSRQQMGESPSEKVLRRHFAEWGEIERVRVLHGRSCGFVTYVSESAAQFAKEAMSNQSLDHNEVLNVRWSTDDPNPAAQRRDRKRMINDGQKAIADRLTDEQREAGHALALLEAQSELYEDEDGDVGPDGQPLDPNQMAVRQQMRASKRRKILQEEEEMRRMDEENARGWAEIERERQAAAAAAAAAEAAAQARQAASVPAHRFAAQKQTQGGGGVLNADALGGLQYLSALRQAKAASAAVQKPVAKAGLGSLADYGSDSD
ncbi:Pre-mRNA-splicing factor [Tilletia horrida]|uniref:Pre-mRNA-splicing factor n=1 Tax=Tilletia horrida TaxID=155126 RepID=A0AAN6GQV9_9BASI|nr:Pre-mRNA-splicing factor [Tilletia horrida]KAK0568599.1 Pre-mRNA-splicing factor [Tilletia horrida]